MADAKRAEFAMRHAVKKYKADCHRYAERAFEDIDRARGLIEERSYFKAGTPCTRPSRMRTRRS